MNKEEREHVSGLVFVALMFIGAGIGLLFGRPDVGGAIGMGLGFLAMAILRYHRIKIESEKCVSIRGAFGSIILACIGIMFILGGVSLLLNLEYLMKYVAGIIAIAIGLVFLAAAFKIISR
ncbi:MAG: hypothetical protein DRJ52_06475 [Thermoprotei archaeon]|nr:MAG: hypothetical protein DRJ52_06475 [Thermoprotei archaeon]